MLQFRGQNRPVTGLAFSPDGTRLAACGEHNGFELWAVTTGEAESYTRGPIYFGHTKDNVRFDPSGQWVLVAAGTAGFFAIDTQTLVATRVGKGPARELSVSSLGRVVVRTGFLTLAAFDVGKRGVSARKWVKTQPEFARQFEGADFFPDGKRFVSVEYGYFSNGRIRIRSAADGSVLSETSFDGHGGITRVSPDGAWFAFLHTKVLNVHHLTDTKKIVNLRSPNGQHWTGLAFHPSGRFLAATSNDATVRVHDRDADWTVTRTFDWNIGKLKSVAFSPDGNLAAAGGERGRIVVWDVDL
jgi:WD40 repeat protein